MKLDYVPLLRVQRELHDIPRGRARFRMYLRTMFPNGRELELTPLMIMNPMGKEHVATLLDALLTLDAEAVAARAVARATASLEHIPGECKFGLVVADDLKGGWTNRYAWEFDLRFKWGGPPPAPERLPRWTRSFWLTGVLWSSEPASAQTVRENVLAAVYRSAYVFEHGPARTLRDMLAQEGYVMAMAGCTGPVLDAEAIAYTREVLIPFLDASDMRTTIECLFGDAAGRTLGFTPRSLSPWAGLALALHDARPNHLGVNHAKLCKGD
jgi:hypothetical protein